MKPNMLGSEENSVFGIEESSGDDSIYFDIVYGNIKPNSFGNVENARQANPILETFGEIVCANAYSADSPYTKFTNSIEEDLLDNNNILNASSSNGIGRTDKVGAMGMFNEGAFTKDEHATFGDFIAIELRNMKTDQFRRKLRRIIQKCVLDVMEEEDAMLAKQHA